MAYSKIKKILFIFLCCIVIIFPFFCVRGLCAEEEQVEFSVVNGLNIRENSNYFQSSTNNVGYFEIEKGYIYHIHNTGTSDKRLAVSNEIPALNGTYEFLVILGAGQTYDYIVNNNNNYIYFDFYQNTNTEITREKLTSMDGAVNELVDNVGVGQLWDVFSNAIPYIGVVALFVFGFVIITYLYLKISKGKEGL